MRVQKLAHAKIKSRVASLATIIAYFEFGWGKAESIQRAAKGANRKDSPHIAT